MLKKYFSKKWLDLLDSEFEQPYFNDLEEFLENERRRKKKIFPEKEFYFRALEFVDPDQVKVVILGQDPYHGPNQANGLSFSVQSGTPLPPSLKNIFKELQSDLNLPVPSSGDLTAWGKQGVLLLNSVLSVEQGKPGSHQKKGWEKLTDKMIEVVNQSSPSAVFILWGAYAQKKAVLIDKERHLVLETPHPSPLSSYRGFFGSKPFSKTNFWLKKHNIAPVSWNLAFAATEQSVNKH